MKGEGGRAFTAALRRSRGDISQGQLGELMSTELGEPIAQSTISEWENGDRVPDPERVFALERVLDLEPGELSAHLGYLPVGEVPGFVHALAADPGLSEDMKRSLRIIYDENVERGRKRRNRR